MRIWKRLRKVWSWKEQKGPLHSDVFRRLNTLQLHAPLDRGERDRLESLRSGSFSASRTKDKYATRVRQLLNVVIGVAVGVVAVGMRLAYQFIAEQRTQAVLALLSGGQARSAWSAAMLAASATAILALLASVLVAWQPAAASSGIPGVIAYLNGVDLNHALGPRVLTAKILGTVLAVGSGLAVGPEGPMIHIGAMVGRFAVHGILQPILRCMGERAEHLQMELERLPLRYDVQAAAMGAGAGIAAAFSAPLAGTLFVVEEAASFFSKRLFLHTFITCAAALATTLGLNILLDQTHSFYSRTPQCEAVQAWSTLLLLQVLLVGVLCGFLGWLFNRGVVAIARAMTKEAYTLGQRGQVWRLRRRRFALVVVIGAVCGASSVVYTATRPCADASLQTIFTGSSGCIPEEWMNQIVQGARSVDVPKVEKELRFHQMPNGPKVMAFLPHPGLFGAQFDPIVCPEAVRRTGGLCRIPGIDAVIDNSTPVRADQFCCGFSDLDALERGTVFSFKKPVAPLEMSPKAWPKGACPPRHMDTENGVYIEHYSPAASLSFTDPADTVRNLLVRGAPNVVPAGDLALFMVGYGSLTILSTGAWVPGGLLVPLMIIGAATGRLCGMAWDWCLTPAEAHRRNPPVPWIPELAPLLKLLYPGAKDPYPGLPPEPGVLALAGGAAFLSGSGALALFVIVLLIEITLEPFLIPVVILAVLAARGTASVLRSHGLYHELMQVQSLPFLGEHCHWRQEHYVVTDVLTEDLAVFRRRTSLDEQDLAAYQGTLREGNPEGGSWEIQEDELDSRPSQRTLPGGEDLEHAHQLLLSVRLDATREEVQQLLDTSPMVNGYPVVGQEGGPLLGLVTRSSLEELLANPRGPPAAGMSQSVLGGAAAPLAGAAAEEVARGPAGVERVMDCAPFVVPASTHLKHAHMLFYHCGLRHVVVVDQQNRPLGLLTRKSLAPWRVPQVPGGSDTFVDSRNAHTPIHTPPSSPAGTRRRPPGE